jgi:hypothetical protein
MEPIQDDIETVRRALDQPVARALDGNLDAVAALDRLVAERETLTFGVLALEAERDRLFQEVKAWERKAMEGVAALTASKFSEREWRDKAQDKIAECDALEAREERYREALERIENSVGERRMRDIARAALATSDSQDDRR